MDIDFDLRLNGYYSLKKYILVNNLVIYEYYDNNLKRSSVAELKTCPITRIGDQWVKYYELNHQMEIFAGNVCLAENIEAEYPVVTKSTLYFLMYLDDFLSLNLSLWEKIRRVL